VNLYEQDFNQWLEVMKVKIQNLDLETMDWNNLLEEIDDMGKSEKRSLENYLERLVEHVLKLQYWDDEYERNFRHWRGEVINFRNRLKRLLRRSPSLKKYMSEVYPEIFADAVDSKRSEFDIPNDCFIELEQILNQDYFG
jgi:Domain of unknown function DUF29